MPNSVLTIGACRPIIQLACRACVGVRQVDDVTARSAEPNHPAVIMKDYDIQIYSPHYMSRPDTASSVRLEQPTVAAVQLQFGTDSGEIPLKGGKASSRPRKHLIIPDPYRMTTCRQDHPSTPREQGHNCVAASCTKSRHLVIKGALSSL